MKTLYIVSENMVTDGYDEFVEIKKFFSREVAEQYIEKHQNLRKEYVYVAGEHKFLRTVGQMEITEVPVYETLEEAEKGV